MQKKKELQLKYARKRLTDRYTQFSEQTKQILEQRVEVIQESIDEYNESLVDEDIQQNLIR